MSSNSNSTNTAILAIFVLVLLAMVGWFVIRQDQKDVEFKVDIPEITEQAGN